MVFKRRKNSKVQWEKQVSRARKSDQFSSDQPSAVSDLSETIYTNENGSDAINAFGKNNPYRKGKSGDSFTLGNMTTDEFDPIGEFESTGDNPRMNQYQHGNYNIGQFVDDDTQDNTFDSRNFNYPPNAYPPSANMSNLSGGQWGNQGSYHLGGGSTGDLMLSGTNTEDGRPFRSNLSKDRNHTQDTSYDETVDTYGEESTEGSDSSTFRDGKKYFNDDFDIPEPMRQSPIMVLYDTILSHPLLTCMACPFIPCLAVVVKAQERKAPTSTRRRRLNKGHKSKRDDASREDSFATYNANMRRFDDISQDSRVDRRNDFESGRGRGENQMRYGGSVGSTKNSEFSALQSQFGNKRQGPPREPQTRGYSMMESRERASSIGSANGMSPHMNGNMTIGVESGNSYSNIVSQNHQPHHYNMNGSFNGNMIRKPTYDPRAAYDNFGNHISLTTDADDHYMRKAPQNQWGGGESVNTSRTGGSVRSVGWKEEVQSREYHPDQSYLSSSANNTNKNQGFWLGLSDTFSTKMNDGVNFASTQSADSFSQNGYGGYRR